MSISGQADFFLGLAEANNPQAKTNNPETMSISPETMSISGLSDFFLGLSKTNNPVAKSNNPVAEDIIKKAKAISYSSMNKQDSFTDKYWETGKNKAGANSYSRIMSRITSIISSALGLLK
jgi:hypothetical protein